MDQTRISSRIARLFLSISANVASVFSNKVLTCECSWSAFWWASLLATEVDSMAAFDSANSARVVSANEEVPAVISVTLAWVCSMAVFRTLMSDSAWLTVATCTSMRLVSSTIAATASVCLSLSWLTKLTTVPASCIRSLTMPMTHSCSDAFCSVENPGMAGAIAAAIADNVRVA